MARSYQHRENHRVSRMGWLRAAVLGANDGIVSTSSLILGVAASGGAQGAILTAGAAGLVAGAMSMAAGEYVSVSSQADSERAELARERAELSENYGMEQRELAGIYVARGVDEETAAKVATQLMAKDAIGTHAREELGISSLTTPRPIQAAMASAAAFTSGAALPLLIVVIVSGKALLVIEAAGSLLFLAALGAIGARTGGAPIGYATVRVTFWGVLAMAVTAGIGHLVGTVI